MILFVYRYIYMISDQLLTQWFVHIPMETAGPRALAGFKLAPVEEY